MGILHYIVNINAKISKKHIDQLKLRRNINEELQNVHILKRSVHEKPCLMEEFILPKETTRKINIHHESSTITESNTTISTK